MAIEYGTQIEASGAATDNDLLDHGSALLPAKGLQEFSDLGR